MYWWFAKWAADGTLARIHDTLREQVRIQASRTPVPTAAIIDSQSVRAADTVPRQSRGWDAGKLVAWATAVLRLTVEIVRKRPGQSTFEVLLRRWVVERTLAWIAKHRRTVRDYERLPDYHAAMVTWAMVAVMTRRLARSHRGPPVRTNAA